MTIIKNKHKPAFRSGKRAATHSPVYKPPVEHYTEVLSLPFRVASESFAKESLSLKAINEFVEEYGATQWERIPSGAIDVAMNGAETIGTEWNRYQHFKAMAYFHHTVRSFLFGSQTAGAKANDYLHWYQHKSLKKMVVHGYFGGVDRTVTFKVIRCDLVLMQPDVGVLQLELQAEMPRGGELPMSVVQDVRDKLRRLYPPFFEKYGERWQGGRSPMTVELHFGAAAKKYVSEFKANSPAAYTQATFDKNRMPIDIERMPIAPHWAHLLAPFAPVTFVENLPHLPNEAKGFKVIPPSDDRLPSMAFIGVPDPRKISEGDWVRLALADDSGPNVLPYSRASLHDFDSRYCYDKFWYEPMDSSTSPSRILNCGYAFTEVGSSRDKGFFMNPEIGAYVSFRQIYVRMGLVAHFQKTALLGATARLSALSNRKSDGKLENYEDFGDEIKEFYKHFIEFTHVFWFDEVSPQEQGQVLFDMWQRELRTKELYAEVRQELIDLMEYVDAVQTKKQTDTTEQFTRTATVLGGVGVAAGLLGMNTLPFENGKYNGFDLSWVPGFDLIWGLAFWFTYAAIWIVMILALSVKKHEQKGSS